MGKARIYGMKTSFTPNSKADRMRNKSYFWHGKETAESEERLSEMEAKKIRAWKRRASGGKVVKE